MADVSPLRFPGPRARAAAGRLRDPRAWPREALPLAVVLVAYLAWILFAADLQAAPRLRVLFLAPVDALVVWAAVRASSRAAAVPGLRDFWRLIALAWLAEMCGDAILGFYDVGLAEPTYPSAADAFFLAFYPLILLALLQVPTPSLSPRQRLRAVLDGLMLVLGGGAVVWYFALGPALAETGGGLDAVVSVAYPVGDLVLLATVGLALLRRSPAALREPLRFLAAGLLLLIAADTIYGYQQLHGTYSPGDPVDSLYLLVAVPFVLAAAHQRLLRPGDERVAARGHPRALADRLPLVAVAAGFCVLVGSRMHGGFAEVGLPLFAAALAALVAVRQHVAQRELAHLQGRVLTIAEGVAEGIVAFSESGQVVWANSAAERDFRTGAGGLMGRPVESLFEGLRWEEMAPRLGVGAPAGGSSALGRRQRQRGRRDDGSVFPAELVVSAANFAGQRVLIAIGQDISERDRAEAAVRESERRFHGIFDNAGIGIAFSVFAAGRPRIAEVNPAFAEMLGRAAEDLRGDDFSLITHPDDLGDLESIDAAIAAGEDRIVRELRCQRGDGSFMWGALTVSVLRDEGEPRFAIGMLEDVSRRREADRMKDEFASVVGHELRTPLTSIRGSLGLLESGLLGPLPPEAESMVATAVVNTDRLVRLVNDVLDLERIDSGHADLELVSVSAAALVEQALSVVAGGAGEAEVELRAEAGELTVEADSDRVVQTLTNLLGNAIKFSPPGAEVVVSVRRQAGAALFAVTDHGRGIPADRLEAIFDRFSQVDPSDARERGGTGLGLAIARTLVEQHGGRVWADSTEGEGTTILFTLPLPPEEGGA